MTESNRIESTTNANTEETIYTTKDSYTTTTSAPNAEDSSTADEQIITQFSTTSFGIATITEFLSFSSTEAATNAETQYTTDISTTDCIEPDNENLVFTGANRLETTTTSKTEDVDPISTDATAPMTQFGNSEDVEGTTALTTESFGFPTNATYISNYSTSESVTGTWKHQKCPQLKYLNREIVIFC